MTDLPARFVLDLSLINLQTGGAIPGKNPDSHKHCSNDRINDCCHILAIEAAGFCKLTSLLLAMWAFIHRSSTYLAELVSTFI